MNFRSKCSLINLSLLQMVTRCSLLRVMEVQNLLCCENFCSCEAGKVPAFTNTSLPRRTFFFTSWQRVIQKRATFSRFLDPATNPIYAPSFKQASNDYPANFVALESSFPGKMRSTVSRGSSRCRESDIPVSNEDESTGITFDIFNWAEFPSQLNPRHQLSPRKRCWIIFINVVQRIVNPLWRGALPAVWYSLKKNQRLYIFTREWFPFIQTYLHTLSRAISWKCLLTSCHGEHFPLAVMLPRAAWSEFQKSLRIMIPHLNFRSASVPLVISASNDIHSWSLRERDVASSPDGQTSLHKFVEFVAGRLGIQNFRPIEARSHFADATRISHKWIICLMKFQRRFIYYGRCTSSLFEGNQWRGTSNVLIYLVQSIETT